MCECDSESVCEGGCSLDRLGGPASLHICLVVLSGGAHPITEPPLTLSQKHTHTHTQFKNKGIDFQAHTLDYANVRRQLYSHHPHTHTYTHARTNVMSSISVPERNRHKDTLILT